MALKTQTKGQKGKAPKLPRLIGRESSDVLTGESGGIHLVGNRKNYSTGKKKNKDGRDRVIIRERTILRSSSLPGGGGERESVRPEAISQPTVEGRNEEKENSRIVHGFSNLAG